MTAEEALKNQTEIAEHYNLGWWYGTQCRKCCGVYPKLEAGELHCFYVCEVCGKRTEPHSMPWLAREAWNNGEYFEGQVRLF